MWQEIKMCTPAGPAHVKGAHHIHTVYVHLKCNHNT